MSENIKFIFYFLFESLKTASRILFIEILNILKKTNPIPNHPSKTVMDNKLEPKSFWSKSDIILGTTPYNLTLLYLYIDFLN